MRYIVKKRSKCQIILSQKCSTTYKKRSKTYEIYSQKTFKNKLKTFNNLLKSINLGYSTRRIVIVNLVCIKIVAIPLDMYSIHCKINENTYWHCSYTKIIEQLRPMFRQNLLNGF